MDQQHETLELTTINGENRENQGWPASSQWTTAPLGDTAAPVFVATALIKLMGCTSIAEAANWVTKNPRILSWVVGVNSQ